jgi:hypothetical protein
MNKKFRIDYGVYCCPHVFKQERTANVVIRDPDGCWQFLCGQGDDDFSEGHHVGVGHLIAHDTSLSDAVNLEVGYGIERESKDANWILFKLED